MRNHCDTSKQLGRTEGGDTWTQHFVATLLRRPPRPQSLFQLIFSSSRTWLTLNSIRGTSFGLNSGAHVTETQLSSLRVTTKLAYLCTVTLQKPRIYKFLSIRKEIICSNVNRYIDNMHMCWARIFPLVETFNHRVHNDSIADEHKWATLGNPGRWIIASQLLINISLLFYDCVVHSVEGTYQPSASLPLQANKEQSNIQHLYLRADSVW